MATQRNRPIVPLLALVLIAAAAGWWFFVRPHSGAPAPATTGAPAGVPARGGELVASFRSPFATYNRYVDPTASGDLLAFLTQAALVRVDRSTDRLEPWLAESWTESPDGLTYTVKLRPGVTFSDGVPFTSADVLFSFKALSDPKTQPPAMADAILVGGKPLAIEAPDAATVVLRFPERFAPGLRLIDTVPMLPRHKLEAALNAGTFSEAWGASTPPQELAGLGPFVLTEHKPGERLVFARNPHYWRTDATGVQLPYLDTLTVLVIPDQNTEALRLESGEIDLMSNADIRPEDYGALKRVADQGRVRLIDTGFFSTDPNLLWFNLGPARAADPRNSWLRSAAFRQAISCAVDRQAIINAVYLGEAAPIYGPISPGNKVWYTPPVNPCVHDVARARQLLASTGLADRNGDATLEDAAGRPARFSIITQAGHTIRERTTSMIQAQLREIGLQVDVVGLEPRGLQQRIGQQDYDAIYYGVQSSATDPALNMQFWLSSGYLHFWNPGQAKPATDWERQIDELLGRQAATADMGERKRLFAQIERIYSEQLPAIYFAAPKTIIAVSSRVGNPTPAPQIPQLLWSVDTITATAARR